MANLRILMGIMELVLYTTKVWSNNICSKCCTISCFVVKIWDSKTENLKSVSNVSNNGKLVPKGVGRVTTNSNQLIYQMIWAKSPWSGNDRISKADFHDTQSEGSHHTLIFDSNSKWTPFLLTPRDQMAFWTPFTTWIAWFVYLQQGSWGLV